MRNLTILLLAGLLAICASCGGSKSFIPGVPELTGLILEAPNVAIRGTEIMISPRGVYASSSSAVSAAGSTALSAGLAGMHRGTSTTLAPIEITVTVEQGTLLDNNGTPQASITVIDGQPVRWLLPDTVGTFAARAAYREFDTSAVVLTTDAPGGV